MSASAARRTFSAALAMWVEPSPLLTAPRGRPSLRSSSSTFRSGSECLETDQPIWDHLLLTPKLGGPAHRDNLMISRRGLRRATSIVGHTLVPRTGTPGRVG